MVSINWNKLNHGNDYEEIVVVSEHIPFQHAENIINM